MKSILYKKQSFSSKFSEVFDWFNTYWKNVLKFLVWFILPICLIQGYGQVKMSTLGLGVSESVTPTSLGFSMGTIGVFYLASFVGSMLTVSLYFFLFKTTYFDHSDLKGLTPGSLWTGMKGNLGRVFLLGIFSFIAVVCYSILVVLLFFLSKYTLILTIPLSLYLVNALLPLLPLYILTDEPLLEAIVHSFKLGSKCWWGFFSTLFLMSLLVYVFQCLIIVPYYLLVVTKSFHVLGTSSVLMTALDIIIYLSCVLMSFAAYFFTGFTCLIASVQYGHAAHVVDGTTENDVL